MFCMTGTIPGSGHMAGSDFVASARLSQRLQFCVRCGSSWELHFAVTGAILSHRVVLAVAGAILWTCWVALSWQADACGVGFGDFDLRFAWQAQDLVGLDCAGAGFAQKKPWRRLLDRRAHPIPTQSHHITSRENTSTHITSHHCATSHHMTT